ncbi:hypothetical protein Tco_0658674 [Tanacetum coccineum]
MTTSRLPSLMRSILKVLGQMTYLVTSLTLDNARSCFLPSILLLVVIIVAVIVVTVILVVVGGGVPSIIKLSFMIIELPPISNTQGRAEKSVKDGDRGRVCVRYGRISSGRKKSRGSNIGDSDNTRDEGEVASASRRSLDKLSKESGEVFPGEARK